MDIISTLSNTISLAKRLKEISKNISEAEFQNLFADLLNQLSSLKLETANLKEQLAVLMEENKNLKNQQSDKKKTLSQIAKLLANEKINIPSSVNNGESAIDQDLFSVFVNIQKELVVGVTNKAGQQQRTYWIFYEVCPKLKVNDIVDLENIPGVEYQRFSLSKNGQALLNSYDMQRINKNLS